MKVVKAEYREALEEQIKQAGEKTHAVHNIIIKRVRSQEVITGRWKKLFRFRTTNVIYSTTCPEAVVHIENYRIRALLDGGSEVNIMDKTMADNLGLAVSPYREILLIDANKGKVTIEGIIENVPVSIGAITVVQAFLVMGRINKPLILGTLFMAATRFQADHNEHGAIKITLTDPRNGRQVVFNETNETSRRNKKLSNITNSK